MTATSWRPSTPTSTSSKRAVFAPRAPCALRVQRSLPTAMRNAGSGRFTHVDGIMPACPSRGVVATLWAPSEQEGATSHCWAAEVEVRLARLTSELAAEAARAEAAEQRASTAEDGARRSWLAVSEAAARADSAELRMADAEVRAVEAEARALAAEARAAVAEAQLQALEEEAGRARAEASNVFARAAAAEQRAAKADQRATIAEQGLRSCDRDKDRAIEEAERRASERIRLAEKRAVATDKKADDRARAAECRAHSCERRASGMLSSLRRQSGGCCTPLSPRSSAIANQGCATPGFPPGTLKSARPVSPTGARQLQLGEPLQQDQGRASSPRRAPSPKRLIGMHTEDTSLSRRQLCSSRCVRGA